MRPELENIEIIEKYLLGQLNEADTKLVEEKIKSDLAYRDKVNAQRQLMDAVKHNALKNSIRNQYKSKMLKNKLFKGGITIAIVSLATILAVFTYNKSTTPENIKYELNEQGTKIWATADKTISPQFFELDNTKDTVIETEGGMILAIPAGCFTKANGEAVKEKVELEVKEALDAATILSSGLSTMSGDKPLETGGMFYLNARENGDNLKMNKDIQANVPTTNKKAGMLLFTGERRPDGTIDWVNPKPLENKLTTVDITSLKFYPPNYEDSLERWGYDRNNKTFKDSLYYSFVPMKLTPSLPFQTDTTSIEYTFADQILNGKQLFNANCATCHALDRTLTGPALAGMEFRTPGREWLKKFIKSPAIVIKSGDPYAAKIIADNGGVNGMSEFGFLSDAAVESIIDYVSGAEPSEYNIEGYTGINPASIRSIWNTKYNNTILATKEFEERLRVIHKTYNENVLMLYVNNIDKPLYILDSMAALISSGLEQNKFVQFYKRKEGGVPVKSSLQEKLNNYFSEKQRIYNEAAMKTLEDFQKKFNDIKETIQKADDEHIAEIKRQVSENFTRELDINMTEAYRQVGKKRPAQGRAAPLPATGYYNASVNNTGWHNLDYYVKKSTMNRETLNYTDPKSGKKAIIRYEPLTVTLSNTEKFDNVFAYLLADSLNNFMLMKGDQGVFKEKLNELFKYDLVVVGLKGNEKYFYSENHVARNTEKRLELKKVSEKDYKRLCTSLNRNTSAQEKITKELEFRITEQKNAVQKKKFENTEALRNKTIPVIFKVNWYGAK